MKNFLRALRYVWPYRGRLILSILCAILAAVLWGLNFTAVYPFLKLLTTGQSLQVWIDDSITKQEELVTKLQKKADEAAEEEDRVHALPEGELKDRQMRKAVEASYKAQRKLEAARKTLWLDQVLKRYICMLLPEDCLATLVCVLVVVIVGVFFKGIFEFLQETLVASVVNLALFDLRNRFFRNVIHLDVDQFGDQGTGELLARFTNDMETLGQGKRTLFERMIAEPLRALACVVVACCICWQLTLMFLILVPIALLILTRIGRTMKRATHRLLERMSNIYKILQESFKNILVVKGFNRESHERRRFHEATRDYYRKTMKVARLNALTSPIIELLGVVVIAAALLVGAYLVLRPNEHLLGLRLSEQAMEAETLLQLYVLLAAIADPVRKLSSVYTKLQSGYAAADRIFAVLDRQPEVTTNPDGPHLEEVRESVEFRNVSFSYDPQEPVLTGISLTVKAGEVIAFVGRNGCGKSTLLEMLPRFFDPDHGSVLIDGNDIRTLNVRSLRARIALVTQTPILFDDSVYNNIAYGKRNATPEEVEAAAKRAGAHEFITRKPNGYQTRIGESGELLSSGQKQRIALARALLRDPSILILDEFNSQIDSEAEAQILRDIREHHRGRTLFIITHRLNSLEQVDRIVVLDAGRIVATGTHKELLETCPLYLALYEASAQKQAA